MTTPAVDIYTAPIDVNVKIIPGEVWEDKPPPVKGRAERDLGASQDVYVEDGKRRVKRDYTGRPEEEEEARRRIEARRNKASSDDADASGAMLKKCRSFVDLEDDSLFDEDLFYVEPKPEFPGPYDPERVRQLYAGACKMLNVVPSCRFRNGVASGRVIAGHQGFGPLGAKAVAISLLTNLTVTELYIPNNKLGPEGMRIMARLIQGNEVIKVLDISENDLGREGAKILAASIRDNDSLTQINAAANKFDDTTGAYFQEAIIINTNIKQMDLRGNYFSELGAILIAKGFEDNHTVTHLDLSYNHIRRLGIKGIAKMLAHNDSLMQLDLSWNGIDTDGAKQLGEGLNQNKALCVLNITGCRVNAESLLKMLGQMKENKNLKTFQFPDNPLTNADLTLFLRALSCVPEMGLSFIDAGSITVSQETLDLQESIRKNNPDFMINYRGLLNIKDYSRNMLEVMDLVGGDPLEVLLTYTRVKNLRLVDLFTRFDTDKSGTMTRQELIVGVADAGIPLSIKQLDKLVAKLDKDGDGEIDFAELLEGRRKLMRELHKAGKVTRSALKGEMEMFPGLKSAAGKDAAGAQPQDSKKKDTKTSDKPTALELLEQAEMEAMTEETNNLIGTTEENEDVTATTEENENITATTEDDEYVTGTTQELSDHGKSNDVEISQDDIEISGGEAGVTGSEVQVTGDEDGVTGGEAEVAGGEAGVAGSEAGVTGGDAGSDAGVTGGDAGSEAGVTGGEAGVAGDEAGVHGDQVMEVSTEEHH